MCCNVLKYVVKCYNVSSSVSLLIDTWRLRAVVSPTSFQLILGIHMSLNLLIWYILVEMYVENCKNLLKFDDSHVVFTNLDITSWSQTWLLEARSGFDCTKMIDSDSSLSDLYCFIILDCYLKCWCIVFPVMSTNTQLYISCPWLLVRSELWFLCRNL